MGAGTRDGVGERETCSGSRAFRPAAWGIGRSFKASRDAEPRDFSARARAERLIAISRAALAGASLVAVWLDPSEPARFASIAYYTLIVYLLYALAVLTWVARADVLPARFGLSTHALDLVFVTALQVFTHAASSPFFAFFIFALVAAALRWQQHGVMWTGPIVLAAFLALGILAEPLTGDPSFEPNRFIIRAAYLAVVGALLAYLAVHEGRLRSDLSRLAQWPRHRGRHTSSELSSLLEYTARILRARMVAIVWWEEEEPWVHLATWSTAGFERIRERPGTFTPVVAEPLADCPFLCLDTGAAEPTVIYSVGDEVRRWSGVPVHADLRRRLAIRGLLSAPLEAEAFSGQLLVIDTPRMLADDLALVSAIAHYLAADIDRAYLAQQLQDAAAVDERARVAHDLHDGVLQSLTGIELKLAGLKACLDQPATLRSRLEAISQIIVDEHAEMRAFVRALPRPSGPPPQLDFGRWLEEFSGRVGRHWDIAVGVSADRLQPLPPELARHAYLIVREAVLNAARHAGASAIRIKASSERGTLYLVVSDDGRGLGFEGRREHPELSRGDLGPRSLRARVEAVKGRMALESSPKGSQLEIALPVNAG